MSDFMSFKDISEPFDEPHFDVKNISQIRSQKRRKFEEFDSKFENYLQAAQDAEENDPDKADWDENECEIEPFNMKNEMKEGRFDEDGNYVWNTGKNDKISDSWLDTVDAGHSTSTIKDEALLNKLNEQLNAQTQKSLPIVNVHTSLFELKEILRICETPSTAMKRLKPQKKQNRKNEIPIDENEEKIKKQKFDKIVEICDDLLTTGLNVFFMTKEDIEDHIQELNSKNNDQEKISMWKYRWTSNSEEEYGPFDGYSMQMWKDHGFFSDEFSVDVCKEGEDIWMKWNEVNFIENVKIDENSNKIYENGDNLDENIQKFETEDDEIDELGGSDEFINKKKKIEKQIDNFQSKKHLYLTYFDNLSNKQNS